MYSTFFHVFNPLFPFLQQFVNIFGRISRIFSLFFALLKPHCLGSGSEFKSFLTKFPCFTASSLFSAVKIFIISIRTVTVSLGSFYAKPLLNVILRSCCSVTLIHSTRYSFLGETRQINSRGAGLPHFLCSAGKPCAMLANIAKHNCVGGA